jgi:uracil-DNA glycosylase family 4
MSGFFTQQETQVKSLQAKEKKLSCYVCGLYKKDIINPKMQPFGNFKMKILNIGEFTSSFDDKNGKPFQGRENILYKVYNDLRIDIEDDCLNINAVMCHTCDEKTGKNRIPTQREINCCRLNIFKIIQQYKPKLIVLFGKIALTSVIGTRWKGSLESIEKWRGFIIPDQEFKCWIAPVYSPTFVVNSNRREVDLIWKKDLQNAIHTLQVNQFPIYQEPQIIELKDLNILNSVKDDSTIAFDYETTGLKPHEKGHHIICCSVAIDEDLVYVFPMPKELSKREPFLNILRNRKIKKIAHNMKYEDTWSLIRLKTRVKGWFWDTMLATHVIDNRTGITGLKFQTYVNFGIVDYSSTISPWLQAIDSKNANSKNRLQEYFATPEGHRETLHYCALDAINEFRLCVLQQKQFEFESLPF